MMNVCRKKWSLIWPVAIASLAIAAGCGKSDSSSSGSVAVSGTLSSTNAAARELPVGVLTSAAITDYSVRCVTLSGTPQAGSGTCDSSGNFSLSIPAAQGVPIGCFVMKGSAIAATLSFVSTGSNISGDSSVAGGSYTPGGGTVGFGTVTFDAVNGKATVDVTKVTDNGTTTNGTWSDPTGVYKIDACQNLGSDGTFSDCAASSGNNGGPAVGQTVFFDGLAAKDGTNAINGMSIWDSVSAFQNCGSGEGVVLPSGITDNTPAVTLSNGTALAANRLSANLSVSMADPSQVPAQTFPGQTTTACGATVTAGMMCSSVTNVAGWGNGTITFSAGDCAAMCASASIWQMSNNCKFRYDQDWSAPQRATVAGELAYDSVNKIYGSADATHGTDLRGWIHVSGEDPLTGHGEPQLDSRFMIGQLMLHGAVGSFSQDRPHNTYTQCNSNSCSPTLCPINEHSDFTLDESTGIVLVNMSSTLSTSGLTAAAVTACNNDSNVQNQLRSQKFKIHLVKQ